MIHAIWNLEASAAFQSLIAISVLIGLVLVARKPVAHVFGASAAYLLWLLPLARFVLPPLPANLSLFGLAPQEMTGLDGTFRTPVTTAPKGLDHGGANVIETLPIQDIEAPWIMASPAILDTPTTGLAHLVLPALGVLWIAGTVYCLLRSALGHQSFLKIVKAEARPVSQRLERTADEVAKSIGLKSRPHIASSLISSGPLVTGLFRPVILLPAWFESDYDLSEQRAALAHDMMHVRRGDIWALQLSEIISAVFWFNPLIWFARPAFRLDQEAACDADVLRSGAISPHAYGSTLLKAVRIALPERLPAGASLALTHGIKERMFRMTRPAPTRHRRLAGMGVTALFGSIALIATATVTATAGESRSVTIDDGTLIIDGETIKGRQFVLLGDPFEHTSPHPKDEAEIERLSAEIEREAAELAGAAMDGMHDGDWSMDVVQPLPPIPPAAATHPAPPTPHKGESHEAFQDRVEAWAERIEAQAEALSAAHESRAEAYAARMEVRTSMNEARMKAHEERIAARSQELEALMASRFGSDFEARIEDASTAIDTLVEGCVGADLREGEVRIVEHVGADGKTHRAACVQGTKSALRSEATSKAIYENDALCEEEKKAFKQVQKGQHKMRIEK